MPCSFTIAVAAHVVRVPGIHREDHDVAVAARDRAGAGEREGVRDAARGGLELQVALVTLPGRHGDRGKDAGDRDHDHDLDEREAFACRVPAGRFACRRYSLGPEARLGSKARARAGIGLRRRLLSERPRRGPGRRPLPQCHLLRTVQRRAQRRRRAAPRRARCRPARSAGAARSSSRSPPVARPGATRLPSPPRDAARWRARGRCPARRLVVKKGSKIRSRSPSAIPRAVVAHTTLHRVGRGPRPAPPPLLSLPAAPHARGRHLEPHHRARPRPPTASAAFSSRFSRICSTAPASAHARGAPAGAAVSTPMPR